MGDGCCIAENRRGVNGGYFIFTTLTGTPDYQNYPILINSHVFSLIIIILSLVQIEIIIFGNYNHLVKNMNRRKFLAFSILTPPLLIQACKEKAGETTGELAKKQIFPFLEAEGSYYDIGYQIGDRFQENIETVMKRRQGWIDKLLAITGSEEGKLFSNKLYDITKEHSPQYIEEIRGMAEGSGVDFGLMWAMSIKSELSVFEKENPGCSTVYYKDEENNWLIHNEDGDKSYSGQMFIVKAKPPSGVDFISLVYPGLLMGVGPSFNSAGIVQTTNYIGTTKVSMGIPRYFLGRGVLEAGNMYEALKIASSKPRAFPWHHNIASFKDGKYLSIETLPDGRVGIRQPDTSPYLHTNHLINGQTVDYDYEDVKYKKSSSVPRLIALKSEGLGYDRKFNDSKHLLNALSSHTNEPYSPCRHPAGDIHGKTLATAFFNIKYKTARYYDGNPCRSVPGNLFDEFSF